MVTIVIVCAKTRVDSTVHLCALVKCYAVELILFRQWNVDSLVEASQERRVDVPGTVGSTYQEGLLVTLVDLCQQLCFHPAGGKDTLNNLPQSSGMFSSKDTTLNFTLTLVFCYI